MPRRVIEVPPAVNFQGLPVIPVLQGEKANIEQLLTQVKVVLIARA